MKLRYETGSVEETWAVAREFAATLRAGDIVVLEGDLGAGKTTFVQGVGAALGVKRPMTSPTFCLVNEYSTSRFPIAHFDLYRLHGPDDVLDLGWEDYLSRGAVMFVEWADRAGSLIAQDAIRVRFEYAGSDDSRIISFRGAR